MEKLLNQIAEFKKLAKTTTDATDPDFIQEYRLFKQYVEWVSEDLVSDSFICTLPEDNYQPHSLQAPEQEAHQDHPDLQAQELQRKQY